MHGPNGTGARVMSARFVRHVRLVRRPVSTEEWRHLRPYPQWCRLAALEDPWNQRPRGALVFIVRRAKQLTQMLLLEPDLPPVGYSDDRHGNERMPFAGHDRRADEHPQHRGIDRVTHHAIRTGTNELMPRDRADCSAPVSTQVTACPDAEHPAQELHGESYHDDHDSCGKKSPAKPWNRNKEQHQTRIQHAFVEAA